MLANAPPQTDQAAIVDALRAAYEARRPVYPVAGRTALDYGSPPPPDAETLDLTGLDRIVDYTPRDMTILVEAGVRMADLTATLAAENQCLPIDVPRAAEATIGGVVATNWNGPRRLAHGTIRDYVIGIHAVDGRGVSFKGGGRVVKNVAGYDFCKLLTGSLGSLGVITQLALKVKPRPETSTTLCAACPDLATAELLLDRLARLPALPVAIDYLHGPGWSFPAAQSNSQAGIDAATPRLVIRLEGSEAETGWLAEQVQQELWQGGGLQVDALSAVDEARLFAQQVEFPDASARLDAAEPATTPPLVAKFAVPPSGLVGIVQDIMKLDPECSLLAHAASGILYVRFKTFTARDLTQALVGKLRPAAIKSGGSLVVLSTTLDGLTPHLIWGGRTASTALLNDVKRQFDPHNILNPGRFPYH